MDNQQGWSWLAKVIRAAQDSVEFHSRGSAGRETRFRAQGVLLVVAASSAAAWYFLHR